MAIERAPYIKYTDSSNTVDYGTANTDIPIFIARTKITMPKFKKTFPPNENQVEIKDNNGVVTGIKEKDTVDGTSGETITGEIVYRFNRDSSNNINSVLDKDGNELCTAVKNSDGTIKYYKHPDGGIYYETNELGQVVSETREPDLSIDPIFSFTNFKRASTRIVDSHLLDVLEDFFAENSSYTGLEMGVPYVYVLALPSTATIADFITCLEKIDNRKDITVVSIVGSDNPRDIGYQLGYELASEQEKGILRIAYLEAPKKQDLESFKSYAENTIYPINSYIGSSRVALVDPLKYGKHIAKLCNTPYYLEPGYVPYGTVSTGVFEEFTSSERDALLMAGLIFGEDDYVLPNITPRMCLAVSSSFGRDPSDNSNYNSRLTDSLIHARRNVDHHIREIFKLASYQLKRNETSVNLTYLENQIKNYLASELREGNIQAYSFKVGESSLNPYCLSIFGEITPINCTLAIEFSNTIISPYAIASNYV